MAVTGGGAGMKWTCGDPTDVSGGFSSGLTNNRSSPFSSVAGLYRGANRIVRVGWRGSAKEQSLSPPMYSCVLHVAPSSDELNPKLSPPPKVMAVGPPGTVLT